MKKIIGYQVTYAQGEGHDYFEFRSDKIFTSREDAVQEIKHSGYTEILKRDDTTTYWKELPTDAFEYDCAYPGEVEIYLHEYEKEDAK